VGTLEDPEPPLWQEGVCVCGGVTVGAAAEVDIQLQVETIRPATAWNSRYSRRGGFMNCCKKANSEDESPSSVALGGTEKQDAGTLMVRQIQKLRGSITMSKVQESRGNQGAFPAA
jgi:hypothetical protein